MPAIGLKALEDTQHLFGWLTVGAIRHQLGVAQDCVERRAQLMTHIGEELRFVLACDLKLSALVLDFVKQTHVLDCNGGLVRKGCHKLDLLVGERPHSCAVHTQYTSRDTISQERDTKHRTKTSPLLKFAHRILRIGQNIDYLNRLALEQNPTEQRSPSLVHRHSLIVIPQTGLQAVGSYDMVMSVFLARDRRNFRRAKPGGRFDQSVEY